MINRYLIIAFISLLFLSENNGQNIQINLNGFDKSSKGIQSILDTISTLGIPNVDSKGARINGSIDYIIDGKKMDYVIGGGVFSIVNSRFSQRIQNDLLLKENTQTKYRGWQANIGMQKLVDIHSDKIYLIMGAHILYKRSFLNKLNFQYNQENESGLYLIGEDIAIDYPQISTLGPRIDVGVSVRLSKAILLGLKLNSYYYWDHEKGKKTQTAQNFGEDRRVLGDYQLEQYVTKNNFGNAQFISLSLILRK